MRMCFEQFLFLWRDSEILLVLCDRMKGFCLKSRPISTTVTVPWALLTRHKFLWSDKQNFIGSLAEWKFLFAKHLFWWQVRTKNPHILYCTTPVNNSLLLCTKRNSQLSQSSFQVAMGRKNKCRMSAVILNKATIRCSKKVILNLPTQEFASSEYILCPQTVPGPQSEPGGQKSQNF